MSLKNNLKFATLFVLFLSFSINGYCNIYSSKKDSLKRIKFQSKSIIIQNASPEQVFAYW